MSNQIIKTYFLTDKKENQFPVDFVSSTNKRFIEVHPPYITRLRTGDNAFPKNILLHADFIQRDWYCDHAICFCNEARTKYKKYEYKGSNDTFNLWFTVDTPEVTITSVWTDDTYKSFVPYSDYNGGLTRVIQLYPEHTNEIQELYNKLVRDNWIITKDELLKLSRYVGSKNIKNKYTACDFVDHFVQLYGNKNVEKVRAETHTENNNPKLDYIFYYDTIVYEDLNIGRACTKTITSAYLKVKDDYKFFAEFLLIY